LGEKTIITGGAGFIGNHLVDFLLTEGYDVVAIDNFDDYYSGKERNIARFVGRKRFELVRGDILDYALLSEKFQGAELVFHLAAQVGVRFSTQYAVKTNNVNVAGTLNVLHASIETKPKRVVLASSSAVYGPHVTIPMSESHPTRPVSVYGASKLAAENYCRLYHRLRDVPVVCLRYHTVFGPRQRPDMAIFKWSSAILHGQPLTVYGDGTQMRDFTYVDDIVNGTHLASSCSDAVGQVINLGSGSSLTINDTLAILERVLGRNAIRIQHEVMNIEDMQVTHADIRKARRILGYEPKTEFEDGLRQFASWLNKTGQHGVRDRTEK